MGGWRPRTVAEIEESIRIRDKGEALGSQIGRLMTGRTTPFSFEEVEQLARDSVLSRNASSKALRYCILGCSMADLKPHPHFGGGQTMWVDHMATLLDKTPDNKFFLCVYPSDPVITTAVMDVFTSELTKMIKMSVRLWGNAWRELSSPLHYAAKLALLVAKPSPPAQLGELRERLKVRVDRRFPSLPDTALISYNHWITVEGELGLAHLVDALSRRAAIGITHPDFDLVIPCFVGISSERLTRQTMGAVFIQVNNRREHEPAADRIITMLAAMRRTGLRHFEAWMLYREASEKEEVFRTDFNAIIKSLKSLNPQAVSLRRLVKYRATPCKPWELEASTEL